MLSSDVFKQISGKLFQFLMMRRMNEIWNVPLLVACCNNAFVGDFCCLRGFFF